MINTFIHARSSLKSQTRFQNKIGKVYTRFQTKMLQKPYLYSLFKEVPPTPHPKAQVPYPRKRENTGKEPEKKSKPDVSL